MSTAEERADLKANPLPDCSKCMHCDIPEAECDLRDEAHPDACDYKPDADHDDTLPPMEQAYRISVRMRALQEELNAFQSRYSALLDRIVSAKTEKEGKYFLADKIRKVRVPDVEKFKARFPVEYDVLKQEQIDAQMKKIDDLAKQDLTTLPVKRAEELIGKVKLTEISDEKVYHSYSIGMSEAKA